MKTPPVPPNCEFFMVDRDAMLNPRICFAIIAGYIVVFEPIEQLLAINDKYYRGIISAVAIREWSKECNRITYESEESLSELKLAVNARDEWHKWSST